MYSSSWMTAVINEHNGIFSVYEKYFDASDIVSDVYNCFVGHSKYHIRHHECYQLLSQYYSSDIMSDVLP